MNPSPARAASSGAASTRRAASTYAVVTRAGEGFIGVSAEIVRRALQANRPDPQAIRNDAAMAQVLALMADLGYLRQPPDGYRDLRFLEALGL